MTSSLLRRAGGERSPLARSTGRSFPRAVRHRYGARSPIVRFAAACALLAVLAGCTSTTGQRPSHTATGQATRTSGGPGPATGSSLIPPDGDATAPVTAPGHATGAPAAPAVTSLSWLDGAHTGAGIVVPHDGAKTWYGPNPGEHAVIDDDGFSWFGSDGSMVSCVTGSGCVGVDDTGEIAVTSKAGGSREVYAPDGAFRGTYSADGDRMPSPHTPRRLAAALAATKVDMPALLDAATRTAPFAGGVTGDPHFVTARGVRYTTQATGQFVARGGDPDHAIQVQDTLMAHRNNVAVVSAVAVDTGSRRIVATMDGGLSIDGTVTESPDKFRQMSLGGGVVVGRWPVAADRTRTTVIVWPDGGSLVLVAHPALGITAIAHFAFAPGTDGLFGSGAADSGSDLRDRQGKSASTDAAVESWRVRGDERIFFNPPAESETNPSPAASPDPAALSVARTMCRGTGLVDRDDIAACSFDVGLTGDTGFLAGHRELAMAATSNGVAPAFARQWPALVSDQAQKSTAMPDGGAIDVSLGAGTTHAYRMTLDHAGIVRFVNRDGCGVGEIPPRMGRPAMRVFDAAGHAVSDRMPLCGHMQTPTLSAGTYELLVAAGVSQSASVRVDVTMP